LQSSDRKTACIEIRFSYERNITEEEDEKVKYVPAFLKMSFYSQSEQLNNGFDVEENQKSEVDVIES
jgi:hypothetical protein